MAKTTVSKTLNLKTEDGSLKETPVTFELDETRYTSAKIDLACDAMKILNLTTEQALKFADRLVQDHIDATKDSKATIKVSKVSGKEGNMTQKVTEAVKAKVASTPAFRVAYSVQTAMDCGKFGFLPVATRWVPNQSLAEDLKQVLAG